MLVLVYLVALPFFWPLPRTEAILPTTAPLSSDLPVRVTIRAWHKNISIGQIRLYVDHANSTASGANGLLNPDMLYDNPPKQFRGPFSFSHLTFPYQVTLDVVAPLRSFAEQGLLGPGVLRGKIDVTYNFVPGRRGNTLPGADSGTLRTDSVPFEITITE